MKKITALGILITILLGLYAWGGSNIFQNAKDIATLKVEVTERKDDIAEIKKDVKTILGRQFICP